MKTYTVELGGRPIMAFRAKDDIEAAGFPNRLWSPPSVLAGHRPEGIVTVRPATVGERQRWTAGSILDDGEWDEWEGDFDIDCQIVRFDDEEK